MIRIRRATRADLDALVPLFNAYRKFYRQPSRPAQARRFLLERFRGDESVIFLAEENVKGRALAVGFAQLYPLFSSIRCTRTWVLYDLFVASTARRRGVARRLMMAARRHARGSGADAIELSTARSNRKAQRLYESSGYRRDRAFHHYELRVLP